MQFFLLGSKRRSFRFSILFLFLSLFALACVCVIAFTYSKNYKSVLFFSRTVANESIDVIDTKFKNIARGSEDITKISSGFLPSIEDLSVHNPVLFSYLVNLIKNDPHFSSVYVGFVDGSLIQATNLSLSDRHHFVTNPKKPLPSDARFGVYLLDRSVSPLTNRWIYLDESFKEIGFETIPLTKDLYDPRDRPWYVGALKTVGLFWTSFYSFFPSKREGISVGLPLFVDNQVMGVVGADLSFALLSDFLESQNIGVSGKAFIINEQDQVVIPKSSSIPIDLPLKAYQHFTSHPDSSDFIFHYEDTKYLSFITQVSSVLGYSWTIVVVAPLQDFLGQVIRTQNQILLFILCIVILSVFVLIYFSKRVASPIVTLANEIHKIKEFNLTSSIRVSSNIQEIFLLDHAIAAMRQAVDSFSKYVPKEIVKKLFQSNRTISLGGEKQELTIFFSDIANFTTIAESQPIDLLFPLLTEYFEAMSTIILRLDGTIDKFIGDGIMAFWGAPVEIPHHTQKACEAALICHAMLKRFNTQRRQQAKPEFPTRFGIHTGTVIVGNIGTEDRLNYTVIGDAVNTTACLQEVDKTYHTCIIISEEVYLKLGKEFITRPLDWISVKGKTQKILIYELIGKTGSREDICPPREQIDLCARFTEGYEAMQTHRLEEARHIFTHLLQDYPDDFPTQIYLKRIEEHLSD